jgi:hypothetical protein
MVMAGGEQLPELSAMGAFGDGVEGAEEAVLHAGRTLQRRRVCSKAAGRIGRGGHEESKPAK